MSRFFRVAPFDTGVFVNTILWIAVLAFFLVRSIFALVDNRFPDRFDLGSSIILAVLVGFAWLRAVKGYRLETGKIVVERTGPGKMHIDTADIERAEVPEEAATFVRAGFLSVQGLFGWSGKANYRKPTDVNSLPAEVYGTNSANSVFLQMSSGRTVILTPRDREGFMSALNELGIGSQQASYLRPKKSTTSGASAKRKRK
jgi:hypothetical protein